MYHQDRIKVVEDLLKEVRELPDVNHHEIQASQELALVKNCLEAGERHRDRVAKANQKEA